MPIYRYQKKSDAYTTYNLAAPDGAQELCTIDGWTYVHVPDGLALPPQPAQIAAEPVLLDTALRERIKAISPQCRLIHRRMEEKIREKYSLADEQYYSRIGVGVALGLYQFQPGEAEELQAFGAFVESVREWGRAQRAELGL